MRLGGYRRAGNESSRMVTPTHQRERGVRVCSRCLRRAFEISRTGGLRQAYDLLWTWITTPW